LPDVRHVNATHAAHELVAAVPNDGIE
jgi:hypothetical protein